MNHRRPLLLALACAALFTGNPARAAAPVEAVLNTNTVRVGDRLTLDLTLRAPHGERIVVPDLTREPFVLVWDTRNTGTTSNDTEHIQHLQIVFSSFAPGEHRVATNPLVRIDASGAETTLPFPVVTFNVVSVLTNPPPALADLKPPADLPARFPLRSLLVGLALAAIALLLALAARLWLRSHHAAAPPARPVPPHEIALAALNALRSRGCIERGEAEFFYVELSAIVRLYLEQRFNLHAPEQTTEEFIRTSSEARGLSSDHRQLTRDFLEQSDLVKFARFTPDAASMQNAWDAAARLVRETIPAPAPNHVPGGAP
jgi:hypothetical protein